MTKQDNPELTAFRQKIDAIDDQIVALLADRSQVVKQVGALKDKTTPGQCAIRPGREADMLRRIMDKCSNNGFPPAAAAAIWRMLISASTSLEAPLKLSVFAPDNDPVLYWLAREYFGPFTPVVAQPHVKRVIGDVMDGTASVGIIPAIRSDDSSNWWTHLIQSGANTPKIFAHIPFVYHDAPGKNVPSALAIARIAPEASSDDVSILMIETDHNVSQHKLQQAFTSAKLDARWINIAMLSTATRHHLVEIKGFVTTEHESMKSFTKALGSSIANIGFVGAYATPVTLQPKTATKETNVKSSKA